VTKWGPIVCKRAGGCRPKHLLGRASAWGALFVAAILLQPLHGAELENISESASAETGDLTFSTPTIWGENLAPAHDDTTPVTLEPTTDAGPRKYFFADALLWTVREGMGENWAQIITPMDSSWTNLATATLVDAPFDWRAGFRVGAGIERTDGFDMTVYYTNFGTSATSQASGQVYSAFMGNFYVDNVDGADYGPYYKHGSIQWDFHFHSIDFEISRKWTVGTNLELRPFLGLKAAIIKQTIHTNWYDPINTSLQTYSFTSATESLDQDFWGIGPSLGVTITMPLCNREKYSLKLFGSPSGAIMFGHWAFSERYQNDGGNTVATDMDPITSAATMLRGVIGLEWEQCFCRATSTVRLGYEAQYWLNQMQFYAYNMGRLNNVTSLQGGFVEWCISF
jgi:hypothetical protein